MRRTRLLAAAVTLGLAVGMAASPAAAQAAVPLAVNSAASPDSVGGCATVVYFIHKPTLYVITTCAYIKGADNRVDYMNMHACVTGPGKWIREEISGGGYKPIYTRYYFRSGDHCTPLIYGYHGALHPGTYHFTTWAESAISTKIISYGQVNLTVHS